MISSALLATFICFSSARSPQQHDNNLQGVLYADKTCCRQQTAEGPCLAELAGDGSNCLWIAESHPDIAAAYDPCVGPGFLACITGAGPCPGSVVEPSCESPPGPPGTTSPPGTTKPATTTTSTTTTTTTTSTTTTKAATTSPPGTSGGGGGGDGAGNTQGSPGSVGDQIDADLDGTCKKPNNINCWETTNKADIDYSTNTITYEGATYDSDNQCCLYSYNSVYTGNLNCEGSSPAQSHWVLDVQCTAGYSIAYGTINGAQSEFLVVDGTDKSTCYAGVKFDHMCADDCDYQVCLQFEGKTLSADNCPSAYTEGWIIDKAAAVFSFNSLDGVPTCDNIADRESMKFVEIMDGLQNGEMMSGQMMGVLLFAVAIIAGLLYRWYRGWNKGGKYMKLTGGDQQTESYQTFV